MSRLNKLESTVRDLYESKNTNRAEWAEWLADNHVFVVADYATELARRFSCNEELSRVAALLHDVADVKMKRSDELHESESLEMARKIMGESGYAENEIKLVVDDAIRFHSCHGDERPDSDEGKILATSDSMAHLKTDFYVFATWALGKEKTLAEIKEWVLQKIERDMNNKMFYDEVRGELKTDYERIKELYSR